MLRPSLRYELAQPVTLDGGYADLALAASPPDLDRGVQLIRSAVRVFEPDVNLYVGVAGVEVLFGEQHFLNLVYRKARLHPSSVFDPQHAARSLLSVMPETDPDDDADRKDAREDQERAERGEQKQARILVLLKGDRAREEQNEADRDADADHAQADQHARAESRVLPAVHWTDRSPFGVRRPG